LPNLLKILAPAEDRVTPGARFRTLRQVVAERSEKHVLGRFGRKAIRSRPGTTQYIGILRPELQLALGAVVYPVPETKRALGKGARGSGARCSARKAAATRNRLDTGRSVAGIRQAVSHQLAAGGIGIDRALRILSTAIEVPVPLVGMPLQRTECLIAAQGSQRSIRTSGDLRKPAGAVTFHAVPSQEMEA